MRPTQDLLEHLAGEALDLGGVVHAPGPSVERRIGHGCRWIRAGNLTGVPSASWKGSARPETVAFFRETVAEFAVANGIAESHVTDIQLAVSEAVTNAVVHAFRDRTEPGSELSMHFILQEEA
jgi:hypothetical protein